MRTCRGERRNCSSTSCGKGAIAGHGRSAAVQRGSQKQTGTCCRPGIKRQISEFGGCARPIARAQGKQNNHHPLIESVRMAHLCNGLQRQVFLVRRGAPRSQPGRGSSDSSEPSLLSGARVHAGLHAAHHTVVDQIDSRLESRIDRVGRSTAPHSIATVLFLSVVPRILLRTTAAPPRVRMLRHLRIAPSHADDGDPSSRIASLARLIRATPG